MKRSLIVVAFLSTLLVSLETATAAPETPPSVTWVVDVPGTSCNRVGALGAHGQAISVDDQNNVYVMSRCDGSATAGFDSLLTTAISSDGTVLWTHAFGCEVALGQQECQPGGIVAEPGAEGNVAICFSNGGSGSANDVTFIWLDRDTGVPLDTLTGADTALLGGTADPCFADTDIPHSLDVKVHNATTLDYWLSDGNSLVVLRCGNYDELNCTRVFQRSGDPNGDYVSTDGFSSGNRGFVYQCDNGPTQTVRRVDPADGTSDATATYGSADAELRWCGRLAGLSEHEWFTFIYDNTNDRVKYEKLNATTLASIGGVILPTEPTIDGFTNLNLFAGDVDGENNLFFCGSVISGSNGQGFVMKVRTDTAAQRWNITSDGDPTTTTGERFVDCELGTDGSLYVLHRQQTSAGTRTTTVRKYAGAGVGRGVPSDFDGFPVPGDEPEVPGFVGGDFGSGIAAFAVDIGFASEGGLFFFGLILVIIMFLVVAGATKGVSDSEVAAGVGGGIAGMGTMVFNTTQELWPAWATVILIVLTSAVILWFTRGLFLGSSGGE